MYNYEQDLLNSLIVQIIVLKMDTQENNRPKLDHEGPMMQPDPKLNVSNVPEAV